VARTVVQLAALVVLGAMVASVLARLVRGRLAVERCQSCGGPASRAYPRCRHCGSMVDGRQP